MSRHIERFGIIRGHKVVWYGKGWVYADTGTMIKSDTQEGELRNCAHCGASYNYGEPDPCIGYVPGCKAACCGHGYYPDFAYVLTNEHQRISREELKKIPQFARIWRFITNV